MYCSFCGKGQHEVHTLIAGPTSTAGVLGADLEAVAGAAGGVGAGGAAADGAGAGAAGAVADGAGAAGGWVVGEAVAPPARHFAT